MGALPLNARVAHCRLIFWWREYGITRVRAGKVDWLRRVWTQRSHVHSVGLEVEDLLAGVNGIRRHPHRRRGCVPVPGSQGPMSRRLYSGAEAMCSSAGPVRGGRMDAFMERMQVVVSGFMHLWLYQRSPARSLEISVPVGASKRHSASLLGAAASVVR